MSVPSDGPLAADGESPAKDPNGGASPANGDTAPPRAAARPPQRATATRASRLWSRFRDDLAAFVGLNQPRDLPDLDLKKAEHGRLDFETKVADATLARFILAEVRDQSERKRTAHRTVEGKATSIIGFATAVLGFVVQFRSGALLAMGWWIAPPFALELLAIVSGAMALKTQEHALPDAFLYNFSTVVEDPENETRIALSLAHRWALHEHAMDAGGRRRSVRLSVAFTAFLLGVISTAFVAYLNVAQTPPPLPTGVTPASVATPASAPAVSPRALATANPIAQPSIFRRQAHPPELAGTRGARRSLNEA